MLPRLIEVLEEQHSIKATDDKIKLVEVMAITQAKTTSFIMKGHIEKIKKFLTDIFIEEAYYNKFKSILW